MKKHFTNRSSQRALSIRDQKSFEDTRGTLIDGERRLTESKMPRLQRFLENQKIVVCYQPMRKLAGNTVLIPCVRVVLQWVFDAEKSFSKSNIDNEYSCAKF